MDGGMLLVTSARSVLMLTFLKANIEDALLLDIDYLKTRPDPLAPYGQLVPHECVFIQHDTCTHPEHI